MEHLRGSLQTGGKISLQLGAYTYKHRIFNIKTMISYKRGCVDLIENKDWKCLRKGNRVRKYKNRYDHTTDYIDGTVVKGINCSSDGFVYVQWDGQKIIDMSVNSYDLVKLQ